MNDLISRQAAIEVVSEACFELRGVFERCEDAINSLPSVQPKEAIPVSWIEGQIERLNNMDNYFAKLTADIIKTMLNEWSKRRTND